MNLHGQKFGGAIFPDMMRWLWRDGPVSSDPNDMVERNYFAHTSPTGSTLSYRVVHSMFRTTGTWWAGENLAWGTGTIGSPRNVIRMWLASPAHRAILLSPSYGYVGVGRTVGRFQGFEAAAVWTVDFGHR